ncbi:hypothetical protein LCGC14_0195180 [marine sediment metagenome]|uniref:Uncharacterized protein n=1 Tax=marine sediment metagenome TaxID=412755 RepID=A0A0F9UKA0_9ZZZZ
MTHIIDIDLQMHWKEELFDNYKPKTKRELILVVLQLTYPLRWYSHIDDNYVIISLHSDGTEIELGLFNWSDFINE